MAVRLMIKITGKYKDFLLCLRNQPSLVLKSGETTQTAQLNPDGLVARAGGPCRPSPKICPPRPCECPPPAARESTLRRLLRLTWLLTRAAVLATAVHFTVDQGVWGSAEEAEELARRLGVLLGASEKESEAEGTKPGEPEETARSGESEADKSDAASEKESGAEGSKPGEPEKTTKSGESEADKPEPKFSLAGFWNEMYLRAGRAVGLSP